MAHGAVIPSANTYVNTVSSNEKISLVLGSILEDDLSGFRILDATKLEIWSQQG